MSHLRQGRSRRLIRGLGLLLLCSLTQASTLPGQAPSQDPVTLLVKRHIDKKTLLRGNLATDRVTELYRSPLDVISTLQVAPKGRLLAAIETQVDDDYSTVPRNHLVLLDAVGQVVHRVDRDVQTYTFSPDGQKLAYVVGRWFEGGVGFLPEALYVLDLGSWQEHAVPEVTSPYALHWLRTEDEDAIFARTLGGLPGSGLPGGVMRYDVRRNEAQVEPTGAFHLSPDGLYYFKRTDELIAEGRCARQQKTCVEVYERQSGQQIALAGLPQHGEVVDWVYDQSHLLLFSRQEMEHETTRERRGFRTVEAQRLRRVLSAENAIVDVATRRVVERPEGVPLLPATRRTAEEWTTARNLLLLRSTDSKVVGASSNRAPLPGASLPEASLQEHLEIRTFDYQ